MQAFDNLKVLEVVKDLSINRSGMLTSAWYIF